MKKSPVSPFASRTSALHVWLRLILAAFVLALYTSIALSTGVARADGGPSASSGGAGAPGTSGASGASTSQQSGAAGAAGATGAAGTTGTTVTTVTTAQQPGVANPTTGAAAGTHSSPPSHVGAGRPPVATSGTAGTAQKTTGTSGTTSPPQSTAVDAGAEAQTPATADTATPETPTPETPKVTVPDDVTAAIDTTGAGAAPITQLPTDVTYNSKQYGQPGLAGAPASAEPRPAATVAPSLRSVGSSVGVEPKTAIVTAIAPSNAQSNPTQSNPAPTIQPNLGLQIAGLVSDVATVTVSAVHVVATTVAQAFGPDSFLGVPYLLASLVANTASAVGRTIVGAPLMDPAASPFAVNYGIFDGLAFFNPTVPPAGADDPSIMVTPEHPLPIILLNGTFVTQGANFSIAAPILANAGYKVFSFNYGNTTSDPNNPIQAIADIRQSGVELAAEVDRVLAETGAPQVILIGHSQGGGILPVYYINNLGGADKVSQLIGISPSNHGTDFNGLIALQSLPIVGPLLIAVADAIGPALEQQALGSPFQQEVYGNGDTRPGVLYTTISTINDEVVTPYTQQALVGPNVTNIVLQDRYPGLLLGHANIITSPSAFALVLDALASNPAANPLQNPSMVAA